MIKHHLYELKENSFDPTQAKNISQIKKIHCLEGDGAQ